MSPTRAVPLVALVLVVGSLAAGFAAQASAIDRRIEGFVPVEQQAKLEAVEATGETANGTITTLHLVLEPRRSGTANVSGLTVTDAGTELDTELEPLRDEDRSLEEGRLDAHDLGQVTVALGTPMEGGEERALVLSGPTETVVAVTAPAAVEDGYHRLDVVSR